MLRVIATIDRSESRREAAEGHEQPRGFERLLERLCRDPELLEAFRADPIGTARLTGVRLTPDAVERMRALERDAVTDVVLAAGEAGPA